MSKINTKIKRKRKLNTADNSEKQIFEVFSCNKDRDSSVPLLYRLVYSSKVSLFTVFILLSSFVFQGTSLTHAQEKDVSPLAAEVNTLTPDGASMVDIYADPDRDLSAASAPVLIKETLELSSGITTDDSELTLGNTPNDDNFVFLQDSIAPNISPPLDDPPISEDGDYISEPENESLPSDDVLPVIDDGQTPTTTASSTDDVLPVIDDGQTPTTTASTSDGVEVNTDTASTTEPAPIDSATTTASSTLAVEESITVTNNDTEFTFNRDECTTLASGSFYCLKAETDQLNDALFAAPDIDGDLEIYLVREGIQSQVTSNLVDDAAPYFDQNSNTIVWHRLIDDRYQIISYDISSGDETQLTSGENNSMEPTRQGKYTVWQNWSNNNWNVVLFDSREVKTITESNAHDIAPYVHGSLVVWNRYSTGQDKTIEMYDIISETYVTVDDPEGLSVSNPRMVFVYDSLHPNGDVVTKGYDMISRKFIQLDTLPRQLPDEIPESESTGETRALIQTKPTVKSDESVQNNATSSGSVPPNITSPTPADPLTLDLKVATSTAGDIQPIVVVPTMTEYELVIPPLKLPAEAVQE